MERRRIWVCVNLAIILLVASGCTRAYTEYPGPQRSESEIAVITPSDGVKIHALDNKVIDVKPDAVTDWNKYTRLEVRAGEYTLTLIPSGISTIKTFTRLTVSVEAGKRYRVRSEFYPGTAEGRGYYKFWVDNEKTGELISAIVESRNPFQPRE